MTDFIYSIILGLIQGITEFLPISSTGHLIIFRDFLGINVKHGLAFDAILQLSTGLAALVYFRKDIFNIFKKNNSEIKIKYLIIGTIPAVIIGFLLEDFISNFLRRTEVIIITLLIGSIVMFFADKFVGNKEINSKKSFSIGLFQALAFFPGMSRSGMTISGAYFMGIKKEIAVKFSFMLSIPVILGSGFYELLKLIKDETLFTSIAPQILVGSISAFIFGIISIDFLIKFLKNNTFKVFIIYRVILALILLAIFVY